MTKFDTVLRELSLLWDFQRKLVKTYKLDRKNSAGIKQPLQTDTPITNGSERTLANQEKHTSEGKRLY